MEIIALIIFGLAAAFLAQLLILRSQVSIGKALVYLVTGKEPGDKRDVALIVGVVIGMGGIMIAVELFTASQILDVLREILLRIG
ncbi:hypothetical protein M1M86_00530 [Dehalococcoidales bacterium]|nr:hypothetical protein [Dehalococcoidales bacterium]